MVWGSGVGPLEPGVGPVASSVWVSMAAFMPHEAWACTGGRGVSAGAANTAQVPTVESQKLKHWRQMIYHMLRSPFFQSTGIPFLVAQTWWLEDNGASTFPASAVDC